jgi:hypothetical protein
MTKPLTPQQEYFRRDRDDGISPPDLSKDCTYAEHIVRARGKRTRFTSVALEASRIRDFGPALYRLHRDTLIADTHTLVEHTDLLRSLRDSVRNTDKADRNKAIQALRYATMRAEGLVDWSFDFAGVARNDLLTWAKARVGRYFSKV